MTKNKSAITKAVMLLKPQKKLKGSNLVTVVGAVANTFGNHCATADK
jgi:hypothetical protein